MYKITNFLILISYLMVTICANDFINTDNGENLIDINNSINTISNYSIETKYKNTTKPSCELCNTIVKIIQYELTVGNKTITNIEKIIKEICSILGNKIEKQECYSIENIINYVTQLLLDGLNPKEICYKLGFCQTHIIKFINISFY